MPLTQPTCYCKLVLVSCRYLSIQSSSKSIKQHIELFTEFFSAIAEKISLVVKKRQGQSSLVARLLKRGIILGWLLHTQLDVPPCSKNLEGGFLASPIE